MTNLEFKRLDFENFKTFMGSHSFDLARKPGLYYITGQNKLDPELGANGVGKSTIWDALTWILWGRTGRDQRPAGAISPWGGKGATKAGIHFVRNGENISILRTRNPNSLKSWRTGDPSEMGKEITQDEIPGLIGMSEEMFRRTMVLSQTGKLFLDLRPEEQAQMFTEALSLDVWLKAVDVAADANKKASFQAGKLEVEANTNKALLADLATRIEQTTERADIFEQDKSARIAKLTKGIETLSLDLEAAEADPVEKPEFPSNAKLIKLRDEANRIGTDLKVLERDIVHAEADNASLAKQIDALRKQAADPKCPTCGEKISGKKFEDQVAALVTKAKVAKEVGGNHKVEADALRKQANDITVKVKVESAAADKARNSYDLNLTKWNEWNKKVSSIKGELSRWKADLVNANKETNQAQMDLEALKVKWQSLRNDALKIRTELEDAGKAIEAAKFWADAFREIRLSIIDRTLVELEMAASRHAAMLGLNDWGIKFDTERETKSGSVSYAFSVLLYPPGQDEPVKWESYSGGESQRWQLATSFALSEVLLARAGISPNLEVLDEPTKGLSALGVADLLEHLRDRALELGRAIYFVDHHSLERGSFDGTLMVEKIEKGSSFRWL